MKPLVSRVCAVACLAAVALVPGTLHAQAKRAITHIAGDLYRFQNNFHFSVFLVTPEGVIATDPINAEAATWLEAEIDKRFARPIRYLVLSHDHADHSSGGEVFADTATGDRPRQGQGHDHRRTPSDRGARHHLLGPHDAGARRQAGRAHPRGTQPLGQFHRHAVSRGAHALRRRFHIDQAPALPHPRRFVLPRLGGLLAARRAARLRHPGAGTRGDGERSATWPIIAATTRISTTPSSSPCALDKVWRR